MTRLIKAAFFFTLVSIHTVNAQTPDLARMTPEQRNEYFAKMRSASVADWQKMMNLLDIKLPKLPPPEEDPKRPKNLTQKKGSTNWYDEAGYLYVRSDWGSWSNYDEKNTGEYTVPDPLVLKDGSPVNNANSWWTKRRPEILHDFLNEIYGNTPTNTPKVMFEVSAIDSHALDGKAIRKIVTGRINLSRHPPTADTPGIQITLYIPSIAVKPVPLIVTVGGFLGQTVLDQVIAAGWAIATVNTAAIQMDFGVGLHSGIIGFVNQGKDRKPDQWGVLAAWCWGLNRALDYFQKDKMINAGQIGIQGHSRWGKAALLAAALDQRWAIVFSSCSGSLGSSLEKRNYGETIDNVAGAGEYHWMAGNFLKYAGHWQDLPVDAHELIALIAPRPVFITGGTHDSWSDPRGEFLACVAAEPVYHLLGKKGLNTIDMPAPDQSLIDGDIAFREHEGGHTDLPDWPVFIEFAKKYFK